MNKYVFFVGVKHFLMTFKRTQVAMLMASLQPSLLKNALVGYVFNIFSQQQGGSFEYPV